LPGGVSWVKPECARPKQVRLRFAAFPPPPGRLGSDRARGFVVTSRGALVAAGNRVFRFCRAYDRNHRSDRYRLLGVGQDGRHEAVMSGFDFHHGFVGFHFKQDIACGNRVARFLAPGNDQTTILCHSERRHDDLRAGRQGLGLGLCPRGGLVILWCGARGGGARVLCRLRCFRNHGDNLADRHVIAGFCADGGKKSIGHGLDFHHRLVGFDLHQPFAGFHRIAGFL
jgi:hypothetical protein